MHVEKQSNFYLQYALIALLLVLFTIIHRLVSNYKNRKKNNIAISSKFLNLNSDQQLLSLDEAREKAKNGQLQQTDTLSIDVQKLKSIKIENLMKAALEDPLKNTNKDNAIPKFPTTKPFKRSSVILESKKDQIPGSDNTKSALEQDKENKKSFNPLKQDTKQEKRQSAEIKDIEPIKNSGSVKKMTEFWKNLK